MHASVTSTSVSKHRQGKSSPAIFPCSHSRLHINKTIPPPPPITKVIVANSQDIRHSTMSLFVHLR